MKAQQMRGMQNRNLEADLKRQFMSASPEANQQSWLICKAHVLENYFLQRMNAEQSGEQIEAQKYVPM